MMVFAIHGVFVGIAAILFATQLSIIQSTVPPNLELSIITASVVGGVSILGGTGTVIGSTLAAVLIAAIGSSLIFINISPYWLRAVQGVADPADRARRPVAAPPAGGAAMSVASDTIENAAAERLRGLLLRHEGILLVDPGRRADRAGAAERAVSSPSTTCSIRAG